MEPEIQVRRFQARGLNPLWVEVEVGNTGNTSLSDVGGRVVVYNETGEELGDYELRAFPCLPGANRKAHVETDLRLDPGTYVLLVRVDPGFDPLVASQRRLRIRPLALQPLEVDWDVPQDLTGDGHYEDLTGDGAFTQADVDAMTEHLHRPAIQRNRRAFDFNNDGGVNEDDVDALAERLEQGSD